MSAPIFERALAFMYESTCTVSEEMLLPLLEAAVRLQVAPLHEAVIRALKERLSPANVIETWTFAQRYDVAELAAVAKRYALDTFELVAAHPTFEELMSEEMLTALISDDALVVQSEDAVFEALIRWLDGHPPPVDPPAAAHAAGVNGHDDEQTARVAALLSHVRFTKMTPRFISEHVEGSPLMNSMAALRVYAGAMKEATFGLSTPRTCARRGNVPRWLLDASTRGKAELIESSDGPGGSEGLGGPGGDGKQHGGGGGGGCKLKIIDKCAVRLDTLIESGKFEIVLSLEDDRNLVGLGFVEKGRHLLHDTPSKDNSWKCHGFWWLRRYGAHVYSEEDNMGSDPALSFPLGSEVRMVIDMLEGAATFFINGVELPRKATSIRGPVYPCALKYGGGGDADAVVVSVVRVRRLT